MILNQIDVGPGMVMDGEDQEGKQMTNFTQFYLKIVPNAQGR